MRKGQTNNPKGRPKGAPNRVTRELRDVLKATVEGELEKLPDYLSRLDESKRLDVLLKLLPYVLPKVESVPLNHGEPFTLDDDFGFPTSVDVHIMNEKRAGE